eukprot:TRINITY_DN774_c0_g1_i2.p1 TRINITY_DN774_c0_g1~~TRINITY_DN774_c0_g1_i2.p1  ORF type:complete len:114 (+),score=0.55 TRINITY_DN774_c0_g1_i2:487-828(+)
MKTIFFLLAFVALSFVAIAHGACVDEDTTECAHDFNDCHSGSNKTSEGICPCYGEYGKCLRDRKCLEEAFWDGFYWNCMNRCGNNTEICPASTIPISAALVASATLAVLLLTP